MRKSQITNASKKSKKCNNRQNVIKIKQKMKKLGKYIFITINYIGPKGPYYSIFYHSVNLGQKLLKMLCKLTKPNLFLVYIKLLLFLKKLIGEERKLKQKKIKFH
jgi:hypothetical protein